MRPRVATGRSTGVGDKTAFPGGVKPRCPIRGNVGRGLTARRQERGAKLAPEPATGRVGFGRGGRLVLAWLREARGARFASSGGLLLPLGDQKSAPWPRGGQAKAPSGDLAPPLPFFKQRGAPLSAVR